MAVQAASGTYSADDSDALDLEYEALKSEIRRVQANTKWNGDAFMDATLSELTNTVQLGDSANDVTFKDWSITGSGSRLVNGPLNSDNYTTELRNNQATAAIGL